MRILETVSFASVLRDFRADHPLRRAHEGNTNDEAEGHVRNAERLLGRWARVLLSRQDVLGVMLPWHLGEGGGRELVPPTGLTVADAAARLRAQQDDYARTNPVCWAKLLHQRTAPPTPLFLSSRAVTGEDYAGLRVKDGITHLDGLHRMLAWAAWHLLPEEERIPAYVAGPAPADVGHGARHDQHRLDVHPDRQTGRRDHHVDDVAHVHGGLDPRAPVGLPDGGLLPADRGDVADVDLAAGDVVPAAVERERAGEPGAGVLGGGEGDRIRPGDLR
ncbi:DUF6309 family protein [Streptomyces sp. RS10V-4]|uniref:DUF6309 family protein n=1 Tax=Streptomyces rhizoryzae TaxID=2932493 RepID=UPI002003073C|nr:DUF6309 family protein [Streptomyces rhizoryzae]MCK7625211.1 DUF6309 family protein [Streptomyces rhizoryzae]